MAGHSPADERPKRLLVLGAGPAQLGLLEAARGRGLEVIALDRDPAAPGFRLADKRALVSVEDEPAVERLALAERVDGVIAPGIDWPVGIAARLAVRLGVAHPISPETAVLATSKMRQRERFAQAGVPQPRSRVCRDLAEATAAVEELGYPCVLKAPDRQGQKGLALVRTPDELPAAVELALAAARTPVCLVEEAVPGREVTVVAFSVGGRFVPLIVTDRLVAEPPAFGVALAHVFPSGARGGGRGRRAPPPRRSGSRTGRPTRRCSISPDGPRIGELAARLGGGHDAELCLAAVGVDLNGLALAAALGERVEVPEPVAQVGGAVTRFLVAPEGRLEEVEGLDEAEALEGVVRVRSYRSPGFVFGPLRRGGDRAGAVLVTGASREEALERADRAAERIRFVTADAEALVCNARVVGFQPPAVGEEEVAAVADTLRSGWLTTGPRAAELERRMADYLEAQHVLAVSSGTAAMHLSLLALGIGPGDEVITSPITWPATANVIVHAGATPVFADVRPGDLNIDPEHVRALVTPRTKAILPVDLAGEPADLDPLLELGLPVLEDAAHAAETRYRGRKVGSIADVTAFSLYATKNIAAGEGGLIATNRDDVADAVQELRLMRRGDGSVYDVTVPGYKANLSDVLAAIALCQLDKVEEHARDPRAAVRALRRGARRSRRDHAARARPAQHPRAAPLRRPDRRRARRRRPRRLPGRARRRGSLDFDPLPAGAPADLVSQSGSRSKLPLPVAERAGAEVLSLPLSPAHADDDIAYVIAALQRLHASFTS